MHGVGSASAAMTVVNALPTGIGAALGIDLWTSVELSVVPAADPARSYFRLDEPARTPLFEMSLGWALERYLPGRRYDVEAHVRSEIPVGRGLKSSSAVASAAVLAIAAAAGSRPTPLEVARLSAELGRAAGVSATGAFDDALAGLVPGVVVTDNRSDTVLRSDPIGEELEAAILLPPSVHPPAPELRERFRAASEEGLRAATAAREGAHWAAIALNSDLVERVMGYSYAALRRDLESAGAVAAGVSGLGPALVALAPSGRIPRLLDAMSGFEGDRLRTRLRLAPAVGGGGGR